MRRQQLIEDLRALLIKGTVSTQEGLCSALRALGHPVTQSKISRLLRKIGATKAKNELGEVVYRLPREPAPPVTTSQLSSLIVDVLANEVGVLVVTSPGAAQLIARLLDHHKEKAGFLGTVAGDDTVWVIPQSIKSTRTVLENVKQLLL